MPQSVTAAVYVAMIVVIVPCLFLMTSLPLIVNLREERRSRQRTAAPAVEDRHLPQAGGEDPASWAHLVPTFTGDPLNGVTEPVLVRAFQYGKNGDSTLGEPVKTAAHSGPPDGRHRAAAHVDRKEQINASSAGSKRIPTIAAGRTTTATTIAAKVSIIPSISITSSCLERAGTAGAAPVGRARMAATGYECRVSKRPGS
jgi:hypothetical protein